MLFKGNNFIFFSGPILGIILSLFIWGCIPYYFFFFDLYMGLCLFMCIVAINIYPLLMRGWSSNSKYSLVGGLRGVAQSVSYEVRLILLLLILFILVSCLSFLEVLRYQYYIFILFFYIFSGFIFFVSLLAELNRTPFDFSEGESELVSGFNIEYGRVGFTLIFIGEYSIIIFFSLFYCLLFCFFYLVITIVLLHII